MWRPDDWENPYQTTWEDVNAMYPKGIPKGYHITYHAGFHEGFEAGADAIVKALWDTGIDVDPQSYLLADEHGRKDIIVPKLKGRLVFIPDFDLSGINF